MNLLQEPKTNNIVVKYETTFSISTSINCIGNISFVFLDSKRILCYVQFTSVQTVPAQLYCEHLARVKTALE